jgi:hypothetical protein
MKRLFLALLFSVSLTACGTDDSNDPPASVPITQMTFADFEQSLPFWFNELRTTVVNKTECSDSTLFHLVAEDKDVFIEAEKVASLDNVFRTVHISFDEPLTCP